MPRRGDNIYKRKDNRWEGRYKCGYNSEGKTKYRSVYGKTYSEVKYKLLNVQQENLKNKRTSDLTVKELFDEWLLKMSIQVKESTIENYRMKINRHILPFFGGMKYDMLDVKTVYEFIKKKLDSGLSAKYISDILIVFKSMTKFISREYNYHNPLVNVTLPKRNKKTSVRILEKEQQVALTEYLTQNLSRTSLGILISLYTGLRIGEICGLKWNDVNTKKGVLSVKRTVQRISNGDKGTKIIISEPKTNSSIRNIPIPDCLLVIMKRFTDDKDKFVLSGSLKPVEPRTIQYRFAAILKKANLPSVHFHSLRHLFATNCIKLGFDIKSLSEILGHSSVEITLNRYVHSSFEQKRICMNRFEMSI